ncbi:membrane-associated phospholipid phosphatase [Paenibacillus sp. DS2015]|uniref:phosphatase PAP2 family protein n=1 Tax=Paenibacillus sp. DS2015 TaxID=3373917 RepID=UPI003D1C6167
MLYNSIGTISLASTGAVIILILLGTLRFPLLPVRNFIMDLIRSRKFIILLICVICILILNKYELKFEESLDYNVDFTPWIYGIEGHFVQSVQHIFNNPYVTQITVFFYIIVFQSLLIASIAVYIIDRNKVLVYATCFAIITNYAIAIPFYILFPVNEVWSYSPSGVSFLMLDVFPKFEQEYRPLSGLNNCFPSLHTSISVTIMFLAARSGNIRWRVITGISCLIILFSIFYLGIHWLTDMIAGTMLGLFASSFGIYMAKRTIQKERTSLQSS